MESALKKFRGDRPLREVADLLGVTPPTIYKWENGEVPPTRCIDVSEKTGIALHQLNPVVYPAPKGQAA